MGKMLFHEYGLESPDIIAILTLIMGPKNNTTNKSGIRSLLTLFNPTTDNPYLSII
jgi:hypothetical protein